MLRDNLWTCKAPYARFATGLTHHARQLKPLTKNACPKMDSNVGSIIFVVAFDYSMTPVASDSA